VISPPSDSLSSRTESASSPSSPHQDRPRPYGRGQASANPSYRPGQQRVASASCMPPTTPSMAMNRL
jgi:hypothetical protein